ncbi:MAG: N-acetylglucosamine-6-phosphate deacetylase [Chloroflexota bacterium]
MLCITNTTVLTPEKEFKQATVITKQGRIDTIDMRPSFQIADNAQGVTKIDATGLILTPGFIDLQLNGGFGSDFTATPETIWQVGSKLPQYGVTAFLPTIITAPLDKVTQAQQVLREQKPLNYDGATPLGLHIEGPFLNPQKKGAHNAAYLRPPNIADVSAWSAEQHIQLVTLAPELEGSLALIRALRDRGITVSAGHSMATSAEATHGIETGISYGTHLFNAMPQIHHREPGLIGTLLDNPDVTIGLIVDGLHVHPDLVKIVWRLVGSQRLNIVTDAMMALGMPDGEYALGDQRVLVANQMAKLPDGTLAGSVISLDASLRNLMRFTGCSIQEALPTKTQTPADLLRIGSQKGRIRVGYDADLVLLTPTFDVVMTIVNGQIVYQNLAHPIGIDNEPS